MNQRRYRLTWKCCNCDSEFVSEHDYGDAVGRYDHVQCGHCGVRSYRHMRLGLARNRRHPTHSTDVGGMALSYAPGGIHATEQVEATTNREPHTDEVA